MASSVPTAEMASVSTTPYATLCRKRTDTSGGKNEAMKLRMSATAAPEIVSYTVYRWECAIRASVMMGFVGAGGLGQLMDQAMKLLRGGEAVTILIVFLLLVQLADAISARLRKQLT